MSLGPFTTHLIPFTKNGKLQFWNDITKEIIEADFSRPNIGATSGSSVWRNDQLIELAENEPDWDDKDGCPVIKIRTQAGNLILNFDPTVNESAASNISYVLKDWGFGSSLQNAVSYGDNSLVRFRYGGSLPASGSACLSFYVEMNDGSEPVLAQNNNSGDFSVVIGGAISVNINSLTLISGTKYRVVSSATGTFSNQNNSGVIKYTGQSSKGFVVSGFTLVSGVTTYQGDIPSNGAVLTRSANSFQFTDLVTQGVLGVNQGSFIIKLNNQIFKELGTTIDDFVYLSNSADSSKYIRLRGNSSSISIQVVGYGTTITQTVPVSTRKFAFVWNGKNVKLFATDTMVNESAQADDIDITQYGTQGPSIPVVPSLVEISAMAFSPIALTEAQTIVELNKL
tara:strand:- start:6448 stop:7638 length:1191 start_codon:yes stop_codon:yes gene_type:complete